jgi:HEPN domain-containing protein
MLTKEEHIKYWLNTAKKDWRAVQNMYKSRDYLPALFFAHLHTEKLCKALWVKNNTGNTPPKIHNLVKILNEAKIQYSTDQMDFMLILNNFQLEGRYPDYLDKLYKTYKSKKTADILAQVKTFSKWLQEQL